MTNSPPQQKELRRVIISVALVTLVGCVTWRADMLRKREATEAIQQVGARLHRSASNAVYAVSINDINFQHNNVLEKLSQLGQIESLSLSRSSFHGDQLSRLSHLRSLRSLALYDTPISDFALGHIRGCQALEVLSLDGTLITSAGIEQLSDLRQLKYLSLARTRVDDRCVTALLSLPQLTEIDLRHTSLSQHGLRRLRSQLPDCQVTVDRRLDAT